MNLKPSELARLKEVCRIGKDRAVEAASTLVKAFEEDAFMKWLWADAPNSQQIWWEWMLKHPLPFSRVHALGDISGVSIWLPSDELSQDLHKQNLADKSSENKSSENQTGEFLKISRELLGDKTEIFMLIHELAPPGKWWYLSAIGVDPKYFGQGRGTQLLQTMLPQIDDMGLPAYLEATSLESAALYARHGFVLDDPVNLLDAPALYPMWRKPS